MVFSICLDVASSSAATVRTVLFVIADSAHGSSRILLPAEGHFVVGHDRDAAAPRSSAVADGHAMLQALANYGIRVPEICFLAFESLPAGGIERIDRIVVAPFTLQAEPEFLGADGARIIFVKILKRLLYLLLLRIILGVQARRNEFSIVNYTVVVRVDHFHRLLNIVQRKFYFRHRLNTCLQFFMRKLTISIGIKFRKCFSQILDL